jgi:hypothetical protein
LCTGNIGARFVVLAGQVLLPAAYLRRELLPLHGKETKDRIKLFLSFSKQPVLLLPLKEQNRRGVQFNSVIMRVTCGG